MPETPVNPGSISLESLLDSCRENFSRTRFRRSVKTGRIYANHPEDAIMDTLNALPVSATELLRIVFEETTLEVQKVDFALDYTLAKSYDEVARMVASCVIYAEFIRRHPEYQLELRDRMKMAEIKNKIRT